MCYHVNYFGTAGGIFETMQDGDMAVVITNRKCCMLL